MEDALELSIKGIKCDKCDYTNMEVKFEDYEQWLNRSCPKCGANLLTQKDFDSTKMLVEITKAFNKVFPKRKGGEKIVNMNVEMNGTGEINFKLDK
jgi:phage FluMu protein Com